MARDCTQDTGLPQPIEDRTEDRASADSLRALPATLSGSQTYSLRETAAIFGVGYTAFWEAMTRGDLPVTPLRTGANGDFPRQLSTGCWALKKRNEKKKPPAFFSRGF